MYDKEAARAQFLELGCSADEADTLVSAGIDPAVVGTNARDAVGFASAAASHELVDPNHYLRIAGGDPDEAWRQWAEDSAESSLREGPDELDNEVEEAGDFHGWMNACITGVGPGEYSIELYDDLGLPGNATYVNTLTFSLPAAVPAVSQGDRDAQVIKAAAEALADHGCIPDSGFHGSGDSFSLQVRTSAHALEWLEDQRPPAEKLDLLLAALHGLLDDLETGHTGRDHLRIDTVPHPYPERPGTVPESGARTSVIDWDDREAFLRTVAAEQPGSVYIEQYRGGWSQRLHGTEGLKHPGLRGLKGVRAEAVQRDGELSGFIAVFRSGDAVHRYQAQADWVEGLEEHMDDWQRRVRAVREEQAGFPHLKQWGKQLHRALVDDDQFMAAETLSAQDSRGRDLARSMFGPDCPVESHYIRRALSRARTERADIVLERQQAQWQTAVPDWAARLASSEDFRSGTTAERAALASNFLYAHSPSADTPELVRLLRSAAADLLG
ncbi:hypothetical protein ACFVH9_06770 [Streptomyces hirsutus]|uniref:hypothetical protein n=1 Tax=Streptomyces hirsutus TaxID=35620 RepID=UPI00362A8B63